MAVERASSVQDLDCTVCDADFHCTEQTSDILEYLESPWNEYLTGGHDPYKEGADFYDPFPDAGVLQPHIVTGRAEVFNPDAVRTAADVKEGLATLNVDRPIITPGAVVLKLGLVHHDRIAAAIATACNEWLLDRIVDPAADAYGTITIAGQRPRLAADEIDDRADEDGMVGVYFPTAGVNPPLGDEIYEPIYEACERNDLPLLMHGVGGGTAKSFPMQYDGFTRGMPNHVVAHPFQHIVNAVSMVTHGVPVRFDVDFVFQEAGLGWVPFFMHRMDNEYYAQRQDAPLLEAPPSHYFKNHFYYTTQPLEGTQEAPDYVCNIVRMMDGVQNVMFASDYPHHDFDHTDTIFRVFAREFDDDELANLFGNTAMDVFFG